MPEIVRCADLFCGCGGLSLGFEQHSGRLKYETVIALDNHGPALSVFNLNFSRGEQPLPLGRQCDLTWFEDPAEILLYYLVHWAYARNDVQLQNDLNDRDLQLGDFLTTLSALDRGYLTALAGLMGTASYTSDLNAVDKLAFNLAISSRFLHLIGLRSIRTPQLMASANAWSEECSTLLPFLNSRAPLPTGSNSHLREGLEFLWNREVTRLQESAIKQGRGQHRVNAERASSLLKFLQSDSGRQLKRFWICWRLERDSLRINHPRQNYERLRELYFQGREINLLLGGPPCKGWSRMGRSAIAMLREQGASAWSSLDYGDERNALLYKYVLFVEALQPDAFVFENVSNFKSSLKTEDNTLEAPSLLIEAIDSLSESHLHYEVGASVIRMRQHALPQDRDRFIMLGVNTSRVDPEEVLKPFFPLPFFAHEVPLLVALQGLDSPGWFTPGDEAGEGTAREYNAYTLLDDSLPPAHRCFVSWIRQADPGTGSVPATTDAHVVRVARRDDQAFINKLAPGQRWMDYKLRRAGTLRQMRTCLLKLAEYVSHNQSPELPASNEIQEVLAKCNESLLLRLLLEETENELNGGSQHLLMDCYLERGRDSHGDWLERLSATRPCKTVIAHIGKDTYGYIHPYENRAISMREAARIQSFPDWFRFGRAGVVDIYSMIGNAVPPLIASMLAAQIETFHLEIGIFHQPLRTASSCSSGTKRTETQISLLMEAGAGSI